MSKSNAEFDIDCFTVNGGVTTLEQKNFDQFVGANVSAKSNCNGTWADGKIISACLSSDGTKIYAVVQFDDGNQKMYEIDTLLFSDKSLEKRISDLYQQLPEQKPPEGPNLTLIDVGPTIISVGSNYHPEYMARQPVFTMKEVEEEFGVHTLQFKGINYAKDAPSVVIVSVLKNSVDHFVYYDYWDENGDFIYTGEGLNGDQELTKGNLAIYNAENVGRAISLFIRPYSNTYIYQGDFELVNWYWKSEPGANGKMRNAIKFRLRKVRYE